MDDDTARYRQSLTNSRTEWRSASILNWILFHVMDEQLIEHVREYEELFDMSNRRYSDNLYKEKIWNRIGEELNKPGKIFKLYCNF